MDYKQTIKDSGIKQSYIAEKIGVSEVFLSLCLNGKKKWPKQREKKLREVLNLNK